MQKLTVPQWAKSVGISKVAAYKRIKTGKITTDAQGLVDVEAANEQWAQTRRDPATVRNVSGVRKSEPKPKPNPPAATHKSGTLAEAQREREWLRVRREQIEVDVRERNLLPREDATKTFAQIGKIYAAARGVIPAQLAPKLVGKTDLSEIEKIVRDELNQSDLRISEELSARFPDIDNGRIGDL